MTDQHRPAASPLPHGALRAFAELARINLGGEELQQVLQRVAELAKEVIPGVLDASVTLVVADEPGTPAFTGPVALALDERQYDAGDGPCLQSSRDRQVHHVPDTATDDRWPSLMVAAKEAGVRSILAVGIPVQDVVAGGLNLYSDRRGNFDEDALMLADTFTNYAAVGIANAYLYSTTAALAEQMSEAMRSRAVIEQAKGVLMASHRVTADAAFALLAAASQKSNRKLRDIAQRIVDNVAPGGEGDGTGDGLRVRER